MAVVELCDLAREGVVVLLAHRFAADLADVRIVPRGVVQHDQPAGLAGAEGCGICHIKHEIPVAASAEKTCEVGFPSAVNDQIRCQRRTVDEVAVRVTDAGEGCQSRVHTERYVSDFFLAGQRRKTVQHAVVGSHVQHRFARALTAFEGGVTLGRVAAGRRAGQMPQFRIQDVAVARSTATKDGASLRRFTRAVAAQKSQPLWAQTVRPGRHVPALSALLLRRVEYQSLRVGKCLPRPRNAGDGVVGSRARPGRQHDASSW